MNKSWKIIIAVVVIGAVVWLLNGEGTNTSLSPSPSGSPVTVATKTPTGGKVTQPTSTPAPASSLSYTELVAMYGDNRIQFDSECKATPSTMVFKNGGKILLDNRSNKTANITIDGSNHTLVAYGYKVVTLSSSSLPKMLSVTCNGRVNTSTINLQANISGQ